MGSQPAMRSFEAVLRSGHKQCALEVPFDPAQAWRQDARPLWPGRHGHRVHASCDGVDFDSAVVARSRRFWLLVDEEVRCLAGWQEGSRLRVTLAPETSTRA